MSENGQIPFTPPGPTISVHPVQSTGPRSPVPRSRKSTLRSQPHPNISQDGEDSGWGSNFWVTLVDPQVWPVEKKNRPNGVLKDCVDSRAKPYFSRALLPEKLAGNLQLALLCRILPTIATCVCPHLVHRLPPSEDGEWWELGDKSRGGLPYYYQTKTGETVWERPSGFVIPLSILQVSYTTIF